jgi:hypothetical protein
MKLIGLVGSMWFVDIDNVDYIWDRKSNEVISWIKVTIERRKKSKKQTNGIDWEDKNGRCHNQGDWS